MVIGYHLSKRLIREKVNVIGIDNINYYDVNLKFVRLKNLENLNKETNKFYFYKESMKIKIYYRKPIEIFNHGDDQRFHLHR